MNNVIKNNSNKNSNFVYGGIILLASGVAKKPVSDDVSVHTVYRVLSEFFRLTGGGECEGNNFIKNLN